MIEMFRNNEDYDYYSEEETKTPDVMEFIRNAIKNIQKENIMKVSIDRKFCIANLYVFGYFN